MKVIAEWLDLKVRQYTDGEYEAYEALTDTHCTGEWQAIKKWIVALLDKTESVIEAQG